MKILFVDCDGVLNTADIIFAQGNNKAIGEDQLNLLQSIIFATKAEIVLSSTWRLFESHRTVLTERFKDKNLTILDRTIEIRREFEFVQRSEEIQEWLNRHPEVTNFAILDDGDDAEIEGHFFETNFQEGLTAEIAQRVIEHLNQGV